jgi:hypothetical protein
MFHIVTNVGTFTGLLPSMYSVEAAHNSLWTENNLESTPAFSHRERTLAQCRSATTNNY